MKDRVHLVPATLPRLKSPARKLSCALTVGKLRLLRRLGKVMGRIARSIGPRSTTFRSVIRLSSLSRGKELSTRSVTRKNVRMLLVVRVEAVKQIAPANPFGTKENPPEVKRKKHVMMRVMEGMKRKPASKIFRMPLIPCALMGVHPWTPLTTNSNGGHVRSMSQNQHERPENHSNGHARPSSLTKSIILTVPLLVSPTIRNLKVTKILVDGGAMLNLISPKVISGLKTAEKELEITGTFQGVNPDRSHPKGS